VHPIKSCHVHICGHIFWKLLIKVAGCMCKNIYTVNVKIVTYKCFIGKELVLCVYSLVYTQNPPYFQCQRPLFYHFFFSIPFSHKKKLNFLFSPSLENSAITLQTLTSSRSHFYYGIIMKIAKRVPCSDEIKKQVAKSIPLPPISLIRSSPPF
jgi:hypothetical protein